MKKFLVPLLFSLAPTCALASDMSGIGTALIGMPLSLITLIISFFISRIDQPNTFIFSVSAIAAALCTFAGIFLLEDSAALLKSQWRAYSIIFYIAVVLTVYFFFKTLKKREQANSTNK